MSTPSASLTSLATESSSGSTSYLTASSTSRRSSLLNTVVRRNKKERSIVIDASNLDHSRHNKTNNYGQMNVAHGNNVIQNIQVGIDPIDVFVLNMSRSLNAEYDMIGKTQRGSCAPQTRQYVLKALETWCRKKSDIFLYWLSGMPGTGKTTIVYTLCQHLRDRGLLGASFFCSRSVDDCQDVELIFPTIAFQLARNYPIFGSELATILRKDPDIPRRKFNIQLQQLIIEPFKARKDDLPSNLVVVLDALDECNSRHSPFLRTLITYISQLPFRLILTSRPEYVIDKTLQANESSSGPEKFILHNVDKGMVRDDMIKYLEHKLSSMSPPPDITIINILADHAGSAFILAATIIRFVMNEIDDPKEKLEVVLRALKSKGSSLLTAPVDGLYTEILSHISNANNLLDSEIANIKNVLFTIICLREPLTKKGIAMLLGLDETIVDQRLRLLRSVIFVPEGSKQPITTFHASFIDFLTDAERSGSSGFYCDVTVFHDKLTTMSFKTMNRHLVQNICQSSGRPANIEVSTETTHAHIDAGLAYACIHWTQHLELSHSAQNAEVTKESRTFAIRHLLHWLECLSLLHSFSVCERALEVLKTVVQDKKIASLVQDTREFVQFNYDIIGSSAQETYFSALVWVPVTSPLRSYHAELWRQPRLPKVLHGLPAHWIEASRAIKTHSNKVSSVAVMRDGRYVVSGSYDGTVRIWNVDSHEEEYVFTGHQSAVTAVAVSSDGKVFSSSADRTVRVWEVGQPEPSVVFRGHSESVSVRCISVSNDGKLACSSDLRSNIIVWDTVTAEVVRSVRDTTYTAATESLVFMSDNMHVVYVSYDVVHIWNVKTGAKVHTLSGHQGDVECVAVSPQDLQIITGGSDKTAKIWSASSGKKVRTLRGHTGTVQSVAFFHDGYRAISGSEDKTIRIWSVSRGDPIAVLTGHSEVVCAVAVFPDDLRVVSGSGDNSMLIWAIPKDSGKKKRRWTPWLGKTATSKTEDNANDPWAGQFVAFSPTLLCLFHDDKAYIFDSSTLREKAAVAVGYINCAAISPKDSETRLATARHAVTVWDTSTGRKFFTTKGRKFIVMAIAYSHDGNRIVAGSLDGYVRVWCAMTGKEQLVLRQSDVVRSVAFSPDNAHIVTSSGDNTVSVWDAVTSREQQVFMAESLVDSAVFSADGSHVIGSTARGTYVWNVRSSQLVQTFENHEDWTSLPNGVSYTILDSSWICKSTDPILPPTKICWIPRSYRSISILFSWKPIAFPSLSGDRVLLTNANGMVVLDLSAA